jgi:hypothetical protein
MRGQPAITLTTHTGGSHTAVSILLTVNAFANGAQYHVAAHPENMLFSQYLGDR